MGEVSGEDSIDRKTRVSLRIDDFNVRVRIRRGRHVDVKK